MNRLQVAQVLDRAAERIEERGWFGRGGGREGGRQECATIAIDQASWEHELDLTASERVTLRRDAQEMLRRDLGLPSKVKITDWNDSQRDRRVVTRALRRAARKCREAKR